MTLEIVSSNKSFGGWHKRYRHRSNALNCDMVFAVFRRRRPSRVKNCRCCIGCPA